MDFDVIVIGSGFGGSVAAMRLSEKGYRVGVIEQGRRVSDPDLEKANRSPLHLFWMPALKLKGIFTQRFFRHVNIVGGVGVGGGSLVYAAVLLEPRRPFYQDPAWAGLADWESELRPHYQEAARMLGRVPCPTTHRQDEYLNRTARALGVEDTYGPVTLGIYFGPENSPDPYFNGQGPVRDGCIECGACLGGCPHNAKNSLDKNYLYFAEKLGAKIYPERKVTMLRAVDDAYKVEMVNPLTGEHYPSLSATRVVLAAGVLGTLEILFRAREADGLLHLSPMLGRRVRTNSEAIVGVLSKDRSVDLSHGPAISSDFHANPHTHVTQNRLPPSYWFMKLYSGPLVDGNRPLTRALKALLLFPVFLLRTISSLFDFKNFYTQVTLLSIMQSLDNQMSFLWDGSFKKGLRSATESGKPAPAFVQEANHAARAYAEVSDGVPLNSLIESVMNMSVTAHILGGCPIGKDAESGVIDTRHEVFGHPGLYVMDGSAIPANVGVNPSLTITAMAERAAALMPAKK